MLWGFLDRLKKLWAHGTKGAEQPPCEASNEDKPELPKLGRMPHSRFRNYKLSKTQGLLDKIPIKWKAGRERSHEN